MSAGLQRIKHSDRCATAFVIPDNGVAQQLPAPAPELRAPPATSKHCWGPEVHRHMLIGPLAPIVHTAGRPLSSDSASIGERLVGRLGNSDEFIQSQRWFKLSALNIIELRLHMTIHMLCVLMFLNHTL